MVYFLVKKNFNLSFEWLKVLGGGLKTQQMGACVDLVDRKLPFLKRVYNRKSKQQFDDLWPPKVGLPKMSKINVKDVFG